jgi:hypothetical protein
MILPRMKDLVIDAFMSVSGELNSNARKQCYELFGFDFLIDEDLRVWLLEINSNPYLGMPNQEMTVLVPKMLNEMFDIVFDSKEPVSFELIYSEAVNKRRPFSLNLCYPIPQLK